MVFIMCFDYYKCLVCVERLLGVFCGYLQGVSNESGVCLLVFRGVA